MSEPKTDWKLASVPDQVNKIVYFGTPEIAVPPLRALVEAGFEVVLVVSAGDKRRGRGSGLVPSPVKVVASELGIAVTDTIDDVLDLGVDVDLGVVVAYGHIIRPNILASIPMVNIHFSLLPRWRGAAPVERALLAGDEVTGVCLMAVEEGLDTGGIYRCQELAIESRATLESLREELVALGSELLVAALSEGLGQPEPQEGLPTYAKKVRPEEYEIEWHASTVEVDRKIRLGRAWTRFRGKRFRIWNVARSERADLEPGELDGLVVGTGDGAVELITVQPEGKPRMNASDWRNGAQPGPSDRLE